MDIDPFWTKAAKGLAELHGIPLADVIQVIDSATSIQVWWDDVPTRLTLLGAAQLGQHALVMAARRVQRRPGVTLDREYRETTRYGITDLRFATDNEQRAWEKRQQ